MRGHPQWLVSRAGPEAQRRGQRTGYGEQERKAKAALKFAWHDET
jgi:hypothetical protein